MHEGQAMCVRGTTGSAARILVALMVTAGGTLAAEAKPRLTGEIFGLRDAEGRAAALDERRGTTEKSEAAVEAGLAWLAEAQEEDGRWASPARGAGGGYDVAITGLALMAFHGAGYTHHKGPFQPAVAKGLAWLKSQQEPDGKFRYRTFYEHGIATVAVCDAYAISRAPVIGRMAQKALDHICKVQPDHGGFRYQGAVNKDGGDLCCSSWPMMAIALGRCAGLMVPQPSITRSRVLLASTWRGKGQSAYVVSSKRPGSLAVSSIGLLSRILLGDEKHDDEIHQAADLLFNRETQDRQPVRGGRSRMLIKNLYYTHFASLAMRQAGDAYWVTWNAMVRDPLVEAQVQAGEDAQGRSLRGSWDPAKHTFGRVGGRAYATALAVLVLETPYRYRRIYPKAILPPAEF